MVNYFYDKEADVFYFSQGAPRTTDETTEVGDDVLLRVNTKTKKVSGFTLLNVSKRSSRKKTRVLPFTLMLTHR